MIAIMVPGEMRAYHLMAMVTEATQAKPDHRHAVTVTEAILPSRRHHRGGRFGLAVPCKELAFQMATHCQPQPGVVTPSK